MAFKMDPWIAKTICLFATWIILAIAVVLPVKVSEFFRKKGPAGLEVISNLMIFGGGVFLATFLLFMVPEVRHLLAHSWLDHTDITYPLPELIVSSGFFLILVTEMVIHQWSQKGKNKTTIVRERTITCVEVTVPAEGHDNQVAHFGGTTYSSQKSMEAKSSGNTYSLADAGSDGTNTSHNNNNRPQADTKAKQIDDDLGKDNEAFNYVLEKDPEAQTVEVLTDRAPAKAETQEETEKVSGTKSLILLVALSVDNVFSGLSLGLQRDLHSMLALFIAVLSHETVIGFSLGLQLVKECDKMKRILVSAVIYASSIPVGIAIGVVIMETKGGSEGIDIVNGTLQGITAGIFLYVTFFLILCDELAGRATWTKVGYLLLGFSFMASIALLEPEYEDQHLPSSNYTYSTNLTMEDGGVEGVYYSRGYARSAVVDWMFD